MPAGAVYQPTTVTYEQPTESRWNCPISYFSRRLTITLNRATCLQFILLGLGVVLLLTGIGLMIGGTVQQQDQQSGLLVAGGILIFVGIVEIVVGAYCVARRSGFGAGWSGGKDTGGGGGPAALTALNPSTDPLVATQYAPVRDAPPAPDDETSNLMDKDKECLSSAEESDKMLDARPSVA